MQILLSASLWIMGNIYLIKRKVFPLQELKLKYITKEIKFRPSTDIADYNIKLKKVKSFILDGDKTKISVRFRGREILNSDMGLNLLNKLRDELSDILFLIKSLLLKEDNCSWFYLLLRKNKFCNILWDTN